MFVYELLRIMSFLVVQIEIGGNMTLGNNERMEWRYRI